MVAYPDTHEVTFEDKCFACPHDPTITPAAMRQGIEKASKLSPIAGQIAQFAGQLADAGGLEEQQLRESLDGPPLSVPMGLELDEQGLGVRPAGAGTPPGNAPISHHSRHRFASRTSSAWSFGALGECLVSRVGGAAVECV